MSKKQNIYETERQKLSFGVRKRERGMAIMTRMAIMTGMAITTGMRIMTGMGIRREKGHSTTTKIMPLDKQIHKTGIRFVTGKLRMGVRKQTDDHEGAVVR